MCLEFVKRQKVVNGYFKEEKDEYKVICTFSKDGLIFQEVMEKKILNKLNKI